MRESKARLLSCTIERRRGTEDLLFSRSPKYKSDIALDVDQLGSLLSTILGLSSSAYIV